MDRRTLLKSAAAISATAALPASAIEAAPVAPTVAAVQPLNVKPYADYVWEWFVSNDGETYYEGFKSKEEALQYARECEYALVAECMQQDFDLSVPGYWIIEHINDNNMERMGEGEGVECTAAQERDLEVMVQKAIEAWVLKHSINITAWGFGGVRNETKVPERTA